MNRRLLIGPLAASFSARALRALARVGALVLVARLFPIEQVGEFAFLFGLGTLVVGVLDLGVTSLLQRESALAPDGDHTLELGALNVRLATLPVAIATAWLLGWWVTGSAYPAGLGTLAFASALMLGDFLAGVRRARGEFSREAHEMLLVVLGGCMAVIVQLFLGLDFDRFQWVLGGVTLGAGLWQAQRLRVTLRGPRTGVGSAAGGLLVWRSRWFWLIGVGALLLFELPTVLLRWMGTANDVALFAAAMRTVGLASHPFIVLSGVFVPSLAFEAARDREAYERSISSLNRLNVVSLPAGLAVAVLGSALFLSGFGAAYLEAMAVVWVLALGTLAYLGAPSAGVLLVEGRERAVALSSLASGAVLLAAAVVLVPPLGYRGAAAASALALVAAKLSHVALYAHAGLPVLPPGARRALVAVCLWGFVLIALPPPWTAPVLAVGGAVSLVVTIRLLFDSHLQFRVSPGAASQRVEMGETGIPRPPNQIKTGLKRTLLSRAPWAYWLWRRVRHGRDRFESETPLLRFLCSPHAASVDVGANYGVYTHQMLRYSSVVHAFEPIEELAELLRRAFRGDRGRVTVHQVALSNRGGTAVLRTPARFPGRSTIEPRNTLSEGLPADTEIRLSSVDVRTLDSIDLPPVEMVKVDVEGHELEVLEGAAGILERDRPSLLVEIEERHRADSVRSVCLYLAERGYQAFQWDGFRLVPAREAEDRRPRPGFSPDSMRNFIFVHREKLSRIEGLL